MTQQCMCPAIIGEDVLSLVSVRSAHRQRRVGRPPTKAVVAGSGRCWDHRAGGKLDDDGRCGGRRAPATCHPWTTVSCTGHQV